MFVLSLGLGAVSAGLLSAVVGLLFCCTRMKRKENPYEDEYFYKTARFGEKNSDDCRSSLSSVNSSLPISQSTPDLIGGQSQGYLKTSDTYRGKAIIKQITLPGNNDFAFRRQLSPQLTTTISQGQPMPFTSGQTAAAAVGGVRYEGGIDPKLYTQHSDQWRYPADGVAEEGGDSRKREEYAGCLDFTLRYDSSSDNFMVEVVSATDLPPKDFSGTSDPYVKLQLIPDDFTRKTRIHRKSLNPRFDETFSFPIPSYEALSERSLQFNLYDFDRFSRHDLIGCVTLNQLTSMIDIDDVTARSFSIPIVGSHATKSERGELLFSLCYLPTAGRLTVTVVKARHLKSMDITGTSDPYVKVALMCHGRRLKKKKTKVKRSTLNPIYNEAIVFDVPQSIVEQVSLLVTVIDHDRIGFNEMIGDCEAGLGIQGTGKRHWSDMLAASRRPVAQWYSLKNCRHAPSATTPATAATTPATATPATTPATTPAVEQTQPSPHGKSKRSSH